MDKDVELYTPDSVDTPAQETSQPAHSPQQTPSFAGDQLAQVNYTPNQSSLEPITWQAAEYQQHSKGAGWMGAFGLVAVVIFAVAYLTHSMTFMLLVVVMAVTFGVYARRPPHVLEYRLGSGSVEVSGKTYSLHEFRAFGVVRSDDIYSAVLLPIKRLGLAVKLYFPPEQSRQVVEFLSAQLPMQEMHEDLIDKLLRHARF